MSQEKKFAKVYSAQPDFKSSAIITVEVEVRSGMYAFSIIGMGDKAVEEAKDRVSSALSVNSLPDPKKSNEKTTVLLAPADLKKNGSMFDVPIALAYLCAIGHIRTVVADMVFVGELGLDGAVRPVRGVLSVIDAAEKAGFKHIFIPTENSKESCFAEMIQVFPVSNLAQIIEHLSGVKKIEPCPKDIWNTSKQVQTDPFSDIRGQELAKRALLIAAAGGHHIGLYGPPGTGKTMLARAYRNLLPPLTKEESKEITELYSVSGHGGEVKRIAPFRSPHHTSSAVSIIGGGANPRPGEVSLAHLGILFMDEFPEFEKRVIESLREPLEDRKISISRARDKVTFPAQCNLVIAMNPCPCGYYGSDHKTCTCSFVDIHKYHKKLSGPLMDRIDMWVKVEHIALSEFHNEINPSDVKSVTDIVANTKQYARERNLKKFGIKGDNCLLQSRDIPKMGLTEMARKILDKTAEKLVLSPRAFHRVIKLARTIADLEQSDEINETHVLEAIQYRPSFEVK